MSEHRPSQKASPSLPENSNTIFSPSSPSETKRLTKLLRAETTSGVLLVLAAVAALIWANSPAAPAYFDLRDFKIGPDAFYLNLSLSSWAADGLLAIFFFLVGLELKREMVAGDLRSPSKALVPVAAAIGGVVVPAAIYIFFNRGNEEALNGWAIPTATDIAFAVAVLAIVGKGLPNPLRIFLLTLAVVDDLIAIAIIAIVYTADVNFLYLGLSLVPMTIFGLLVHLRPDVFAHRRRHAWWLLLPLAFATWTLIHASGVHATIAGVLLGFIVPVSGRFGVELAEIFEHRFQPLSVAFAVPIFAFFSAGVAVGGFDGLVSGLTDPVAIGIIAALVIGKPVGIMLTTFLVTKLTSANLDSSVKWPDVLGVSALAGIGFTVSLLVTELSFPADSAAHDDAKVAILVASAIAAVGAGILLTFRGKKHQAQEQDSLYTS